MEVFSDKIIRALKETIKNSIEIAIKGIHFFIEIENF
jgi:hypothetical protein